MAMNCSNCSTLRLVLGMALAATYGPYEDAALDNLPLEDQLRDIPVEDGGGIGWLG